MKLYRTQDGIVVERESRLFLIGPAGVEPWDALLKRDDLHDHLDTSIQGLAGVSESVMDRLLAPVGTQEVWAAGVTYFRSRDARMQESKSSGGGDFYDRVYSAERPELFFKSTPNRVVGPNGSVAIRDDAKWSVPEPELTVLIAPSGRITGYTIGNDMSSRDIEGENPLYLPQAKVYDRSCALGPCILVEKTPLAKETAIRLEITRGGRSEFSASTSLEAMKRDVMDLAGFLYRNNSFPNGCFLLTGTGIVPEHDFTLKSKDEIKISIDRIGTLVNVVA